MGGSCTCFKAEDKGRILKIIESYPGGLPGFNCFIRGLAAELFGVLPPHRLSAIAGQECETESNAGKLYSLDTSVSSGDIPEQCEIESNAEKLYSLDTSEFSGDPVEGQRTSTHIDQLDATQVDSDGLALFS